MGIIAQNSLGKWVRSWEVGVQGSSNEMLSVNGEVVHRNGTRFLINTGTPPGFTRQSNGRFRPNSSGWWFIGADPHNSEGSRFNLTYVVRDNNGTRWRHSRILEVGGAVAMYLYSDWELELAVSATGLAYGMSGQATDISTGILPFTWRPTGLNQTRTIAGKVHLINQANNNPTLLQAISPDGTQTRSVQFPSGGNTGVLDCRWPDGWGTVKFVSGTPNQDLYFTPIELF